MDVDRFRTCSGILRAGAIAAALVLAGCHSASNGQQADGGGDGDSGVIIIGGNGTLPEFTNVTATVHGTSVTIAFDQVDGAKDYRVYPKPQDKDLVDGGPAIHNAIYRCAGDREAPRAPTDGEPKVQSEAILTFVDHDVKGFARKAADATLGYVFTTAGAGRTPVYVLGDPAPDADNLCYQQRWYASRVKKYVTTDAERATLLAAAWRDDGIAFYLPAAGAGTRTISTAIVDGAPLYFAADSPEAAARAGANPSSAFPVLTATESGAQPLGRVYYDNSCGRGHDELARGQAAFSQTVHQGNRPVGSVFWAGLTGPTRLVVEALDQGCPFQGFLSTAAFAAQTTDGVPHQPWFTLADIQAASLNGEVFVNGQHEAANRPRAIALTYVDVSPAPAESYDFRDAFDDGVSPGALTELAAPAYFHSKRFDSTNYDITFYAISLPLLAMGPLNGELFVTYADSAGDTNGKFRLTPKKKASLTATAYLHATMEVDMVSSARRYPQILISDRGAPVQDTLPLGSTIVVQPIGLWSQDAPRMDIQLCDHRNWDVNDQCPRFPLHPEAFENKPLPPHQEVGELFGNERRVRWDVYASTSRVYLLLGGKAFGCANLPAGTMPAGPVTVTYGDVLYHSLVDVPDPPYKFHSLHMAIETQRHFGELAFSSNVAAPAWDETRLPCTSTLK